MALMPMGQALSILAERDPSHVAVVCGDEVLTRDQLDQRANRLARAYAQLGVGQDDVVALVLPNSVELVAAFCAVWKLGATPMPVSARLPDAELGPILELAAPRLVVGLAAERVPGGTASVPSGFEPPAGLDDGPLPPAAARYYRALTSGGSTGRPKVIVSHQPALCDPDAGEGGVGPDRVHLVTSPMFHTLGLSSLFTLLAGGTLVLMARFGPSETLRLVEEHRVTYLPAVPTMLHRIWRLPPEERSRYDLSSLQTVFSTAGPFPAWLKKAWIDWVGPEKVLEIYGSSEKYGSTVVTGEEALRKPGTVGKPRFGPPRILDEDGNDLPPGQVGLIYFERPAEPNYHYVGAQPRVLGGWETLGDMGWLDDDGYLFLSDRRVDMVVTGGENVFPAEVEAALDEHPAVRSSVVIGLPDDDLGQRLHAIVDVGRDDGSTAAVTEEQLVEHLRARVDRYKLPRSFEFVTEPLRTDAGKVRRSQLRDERIARVL